MRMVWQRCRRRLRRASTRAALPRSFVQSAYSRLVVIIVGRCWLLDSAEFSLAPGGALGGRPRSDLGAGEA